MLFYKILLCRSYQTPTPSNDVISENLGRLFLVIDNSLRKGSSRNFHVHVIFRHDVYCYLFDNNSKYFKEGWDQCYKDYRIGDSHNYGVKLLYPVQCRLYLNFMKAGHYKKGDSIITCKARSFVEMVKFKIKNVIVKLLL